MSFFSSLTIIIGGILAIPSLLVQIIVAPLVFVVSLPAVAVLKFRKNNNVKSASNSHVIISGGSSGIGLCVAQECLYRGVDRITLLARNKEKLKQAKEMLEKEAGDKSTKIDVVSVDVTNPKAIQDVAKQVCGKSNSTSTTTATSIYLFNCAGIAYPGYFEKMDIDTFTKTTELNLLGTLYTTHAFIKYIQQGTIILTSSMGGQCGAFGYTSYAPSKMALKGFAEALHMELVNSPINVQVVYPPDTDTPGYAEENKLKPKECFLISESVGFYKPDVVARVMVREAMKPNPKFAVYYGLDGYILSTMTAGFGPEPSLVDALSQVSFAGLFRLISFFYLNDFWRIIRKCGKESDEEKESSSYGSMRQASSTNVTSSSSDE